MVCSSNFSKQKMTCLWNLQTCENLINLRAQYQNNFEYARNSDHAGLWERIAININQINNIQISARQCQNKWHSLIRGYNNIKRILNRDTRGARRTRNVASPNRYDIQFYELMRSEFWLPRGNNSS
jgi:hypothetical protein